ncbi:MaoC family dehydratase [Actinomadura chokoriensis]|uniref:MaoC family dehydratase n=1 Tax=Actinomadura chokoriensis TaxID=454156 RepID=A0ABV4RBR9_9ACTN
MTVRIGDELPSRDVRSVDAEKMKTMAALLSDANPIHWDVEAVRATGLGDRPINQGPTNMAYVLDMLSSWAGGHDRLRRVRLRFTGNVFAGDHVRAAGTVTDVRDEGGATVAECEVRLDVVGGGTVLSGTALVTCEPAGPDETAPPAE